MCDGKEEKQRRRIESGEDERHCGWKEEVSVDMWWKRGETKRHKRVRRRWDDHCWKCMTPFDLILW
jgi:hypothetical protein